MVGNPCAEVAAVTSVSNAGQPVTAVHPHLAKLTDLAFSADISPEEATGLDAIFMALPHGGAIELCSGYTGSTRVTPVRAAKAPLSST